MGSPESVLKGLERCSPNGHDDTMIQAFADDSVTPDVVACGVAVFQEERVAAAEELLCSEKVAVGIPADERLHCRVMFSDHGRRGTPWERLGPKGVYALVERVCERVRHLSERPLVSVVDPRGMPPGPLTPGGPIRSLDPKAIATMTYMGAWGGLLRRHQVGGFRLWIDPDSTKIQWGAGRRQADSTRGMYVDLGAGQEPPLLEPTFSDGPPPALLQLADVYAYIAVQSHGGRGGWRTRWFQGLYAAIDAQVETMMPNTEPMQWFERLPDGSNRAIPNEGSEEHST